MTHDQPFQLSSVKKMPLIIIPFNPGWFIKFPLFDYNPQYIGYPLANITMENYPFLVGKSTINDHFQ
jgi:hypothetical protein